MLSPHVMFTLWNTSPIWTVHIQALKQYSEKAQAFFMANSISWNTFGQPGILQNEPTSQDLHQPPVTGTGERKP